MKFNIKTLSVVLKIILWYFCIHQALAQWDKASFLSSDFSLYDQDMQIFYGQGNVKILLDDYLIVTDRILYDVKSDLIYANGDVIIFEPSGRVSKGRSILFKDNFNQGLITNFVVKWDDDIILAANLAKKINKDRAALYKATFTPCKIGDNCSPIWQISAKNTDINFEKHTITYKHVFFKVYNAPVFYTPYFSHPTPNAPAKSGLLVPSVVNSGLKVPFYYRFKPNLDLTLSPRITKNAVIYEFEMRHRIEVGSYKITNFLGKVPYKDGKIYSNYFKAQGDFGEKLKHYGFDINFVSDKAFLQNYYNAAYPYLSSKIYLENIEQSNYFSVEGLHYRDLKVDKNQAKDPLILPKIKTKNLIFLNDDKDYYFQIESDFLFYKQKENLDLTRGSILFSVIKDITTKQGYLINYDLSNRVDAYAYKSFNKKINALRSVPQAQLKVSYPMIRNLENSLFLIEPTVSLVGSPKYKQSYIKKFDLIDPSLYDLSEINIFSSNKYSGIDHHELGSRIAYGINSSLMTQNQNINVFIGQFLKFSDRDSNSDKLNNIASLSFSPVNNLEIFYKFRKTEKFRSIKDELGLNLNFSKITFTTGLIKLENIKKYYLDKGATLPKNHLKQGYTNITYRLNDNWTLNNEMQFELYGRSMKLIYKSIGVTYFKDCVRIGLIFYDNYTHDQKLGVKKISNKTFAVGLKVLNM